LANRFTGRPIEIRYAAGLRDTSGNPAHAATFIRRRLVVLDSELREGSEEHRRILLHELFHFVWVRLGNPKRLAWEEILASEWRKRARGETGWSAEWRKRELRAEDAIRRTKAWREYCCESFCDTAAWVFGGADSELTLARGHRGRRKYWFSVYLETAELPI
jgi:hypothetical protein